MFPPHLMLHFFILGGMLVSSTCSFSSASTIAPPIVYTIAGSDSGGGAGIQADLHAIHAMKCHGCSAITCLTAQNSVGVTSVHAPPASFLKAQLEALTTDLPPYAVKIGMLGNDPTVAETVGAMLQEFRNNQNNHNKVWIVLDPVMISTSGHKLINDEAKAAMIQHVCPYADIITPNKFEAEAFLGRKLMTPEDIEKGAEELLHSLGCKAVLIKGGHTLVETQKATEAEKEDNPSKEIQATLQYAQDYLLSSETIAKKEYDVRLCDGNRGVWMRTRR
jgi:hydroxymethylpyrimidine kinase/phosphomethylpyrimidine kinase